MKETCSCEKYNCINDKPGKGRVLVDREGHIFHLPEPIEVCRELKERITETDIKVDDKLLGS
jgi:hypothetical protein